MLLKIHLLQVMCIGVITVRIKAQEPTLTEVPDLYMEDRDKAIMSSIWNMAGFPSDQNEPKPEVSRKFFGVLAKFGPRILKGVIPHIGKIPGFPDQIKPVLPILTSLIPERMIDATGIKHTINKNRQQIGRSHADSLTTINSKGLKTPHNSELDSSEGVDSPELNSNRRALHLKNSDLEFSDDNHKETNRKYYLTENLEASPQDLEIIDDNAHYNKKSSWNFWNSRAHQNMNVGEQSHNTTTKVDISSSSPKIHKPFDMTYIGPYREKVDVEHKNSHMDSMHQRKYKTANAARNSDTSSQHPISHECAEKRKEPSRTSDKSPDISKYFEMFQNNQLIHNVKGYNPMMHQP